MFIPLISLLGVFEYKPYPEFGLWQFRDRIRNVVCASGGTIITKFNPIALQTTSGMEMNKACSYCTNKKCCFSIGLSPMVIYSTGYAAV